MEQGSKCISAILSGQRLTPTILWLKSRIILRAKSARKNLMLCTPHCMTDTSTAPRIHICLRFLVTSRAMLACIISGFDCLARTRIQGETNEDEDLAQETEDRKGLKYAWNLRIPQPPLPRHQGWMSLFLIRVLMLTTLCLSPWEPVCIGQRVKKNGHLRVAG